MPPTFATSVTRNGKIYVFSNGLTDDGVNRVIQVLTKSRGSDSYTRYNLKVGKANVPASDGPLASVIVGNPTNGIRLYVVNNKKVVEYGLDSQVGAEDVWKKEDFVGNIGLDANSYLTALGTQDLAGVTHNGKAAMLRVFYQTGSEPFQSTYTSDGWSDPEKIEL